MKLLRLYWELLVQVHTTFQNYNIFFAVIIEVVISNLPPVITNWVPIIGYIFRIVDKGPNAIMMP